MIALFLKKAILVGMMLGILSARRKKQRLAEGGFCACQARQEERA